MQVSCTITISVDSFSINTLEQAAMEGTKGTGKKLFEVLLSLAEKTLSMECICGCRGCLESKVERRGGVMTIVGDIV